MNYAVFTMTMNQRLAEAGIQTTRDGERVYLSFEGKTIKRPHVDNCERECLMAFGLVI